MLTTMQRTAAAKVLEETGRPMAAASILCPVPHLGAPSDIRGAAIAEWAEMAAAIERLVWLLGADGAVAALRTASAPLPVVDAVNVPEWAGRGPVPVPEMVFDGRLFAAEQIRAGALAVGDYYVPAALPEYRSPREVTAVIPFARGEILQLRYFVAGEDRERFYDPERAVVRLLPAD